MVTDRVTYWLVSSSAKTISMIETLFSVTVRATWCGGLKYDTSCDGKAVKASICMCKYMGQQDMDNVVSPVH